MTNLIVVLIWSVLLKPTVPFSVVSVCNPNPCKNGGTCVSDKKDFECQCPPGYTGNFCQIGECYTVSYFLLLLANMFSVVPPTLAFCAIQRPWRLLRGRWGVIPRQCEWDRERSRVPLLDLALHSREWGRSHQLLRWRWRTWPSQLLQVSSGARRLGSIANITNIVVLTLMFWMPQKPRWRQDAMVLLQKRPQFAVGLLWCVRVPWTNRSDKFLTVCECCELN